MALRSSELLVAAAVPPEDWHILASALGVWAERIDAPVLFG